MSRRLLALCLALLTLPSALAAQTDVVRGTVTGPDNSPIERANVTVTTLSGNVSRSVRTARDGRFTIAFPGNDGNYMVTVAAIGYNAARFEVKRTADQTVLIADVKLSASSMQLDTVRVSGRNRVGRADTLTDVSGSARVVDNAAVSADQLGNLASLAASLPGVQFIPGTDGAPNSFSVLGLAGDQNLATLNGLIFGGANLPRDANVTTSLVTTPYDVSRGGFAGGLLSVQSRPGNNYIVRSSSVNFDSPRMQWSDAAAHALGQQYGNVSAGGLFSGPIQTDKSFYSIAYQAGRRAQDYQTLLNIGSAGLQAAGVAPDSVTRLLALIQRAGAASSVNGLPTGRSSDNALVFGTIDYVPPTSVSGQAFNLTFNGSFDRQRPANLTTYELPIHGGERTTAFGVAQGRHSGYFGYVLSETSIGLSQSSSRGNPFADLPSASVRVASTFADSPPSVQLLAFGGNPGLDVRQSARTLQARNQLSWFSDNNKHTLQLTTELRRDAFEQDFRTNALGSFSYNSLADLEADRPSAFARQLSPRFRSGGATIGAVAFGDSYRPKRGVQLQYGVRLDANHFDTGPATNSDVEATLGHANDYAPNNIALSPRFGFSWAYGRASEVSAFQGSAAAPRAVVRGGVGVFQNLPNAQSLGMALDNTGLPSAVQQLLCVGGAVPIPNWPAYAAGEAAIPARCADGSAGSVFSNTAPNVTLFDSRYKAPRSLRSNVQWAGALLDNRFSATVDATYSLNLDQTSSRDLNFAATPQFVLANEGSRPVYAPAASVVPVSGAIAGTAARVSPRFSHVTALVSDMTSESRQLTVSVSPVGFNSRYGWSLSYVYADTRERFLGFVSTAGNPLDAAWSRSGFDSRHQFIYTLSYNAFDVVRLGWFGWFRSGTPYTPLVTGDINGDGYVNDRAFIFDPASVSDTSLANGMRSLLTVGSRSARDCLASQLGRVASRNSCQGPWTSAANLTISFNPMKVRMPQRATLTFQIANPLGGADLLLHGERGLRGWGQPFTPTSSLLFVRGFDPTTQHFQYAVNQRFGATASSLNITRSPVTLTALLRVDIGPSRERQDLTQALDFGRTRGKNKVTAGMLRSAVLSGGIMNPMAQILRQSDTLGLSQDQADSIALLNRAYIIRLDSIWVPTARFLADLPDRYDQDDAYRHYRVAREASIDALMRLSPMVKSLLTGEQLRRLPSVVSSFLDPRYLAAVRSSTSGSGLASIVAPPAAGAMMRTAR